MRHIIIFALLFLPALAVAQDSLAGKPVEVSLMTEVNYGRQHDSGNAALVDFPHLLICGNAALGRG